jgi:hypothetical protein
MADFNKAFNNDFVNEEYSKSNKIDFFFTTRRTKNTIEELNKKLERVEKEVYEIHNFIVLNLPIDEVKNNDNVELEIWGDRGYFYKGNITNNQGYFPLISLKLREDTQLFLKMNIIKDNMKPLNYINFIKIPKKYQNGNEEEDSEN